MYSTLGVSLTFLKELDICEFGPGGGFNATATSKFQPQSYYFVEGSKLGLETLKYFFNSNQGK